MSVLSAAAPDEKHETAKLGLWLFLASEVMMFGGFLASYILLRTANPGMAADSARLDRLLACVNTIILIGSSLTMALAVAAAQRGDTRGLRLNIALTIAMGIAFLAIKGVEYGGKFHHGVYPWTSIFFSCYFTMTGLHGVHVLGGLVLLLMIWTRAGSLSQGRATFVEMSGLYWHFVDVVWIFLFPLLYLL